MKFSPPWISKIYGFQVVFRPKRMRTPPLESKKAAPEKFLCTPPPQSLPNSLIVDSVYDGVPSVHVGVAVRPKINTCSTEMSTRVNRADNTCPQTCMHKCLKGAKKKDFKEKA